MSGACRGCPTHDQGGSRTSRLSRGHHMTSDGSTARSGSSRPSNTRPRTAAQPCPTNPRDGSSEPPSDPVLDMIVVRPRAPVLVRGCCRSADSPAPPAEPCRGPQPPGFHESGSRPRRSSRAAGRRSSRLTGSGAPLSAARRSSSWADHQVWEHHEDRVLGSSVGRRSVKALGAVTACSRQFDQVSASASGSGRCGAGCAPVDRPDGLARPLSCRGPAVKTGAATV